MITEFLQKVFWVCAPTSSGPPCRRREIGSDMHVRSTLTPAPSQSGPSNTIVCPAGVSACALSVVPGLAPAPVPVGSFRLRFATWIQP